MKTQQQQLHTAIIFDINNLCKKITLNQVYLNDENKNYVFGAEYKITISNKQMLKIKNAKKSGYENLARIIKIKRKKDGSRGIIIGPLL